MLDSAENSSDNEGSVLGFRTESQQTAVLFVRAAVLHLRYLS